MWTILRNLIWLTLVTGVAYPLLITCIAQLTTKAKADGGLVTNKKGVIGAELIGQKFSSERYFWSRPSANEYNPLPSTASNLGPTSAALKTAVEMRRKALLSAHAGATADQIPPDMLFASGSGLDPHLHVTSAYFQVARVAKARNLEEEKVKKLIEKLATRKAWGVFGENYVNVLDLNLALDRNEI